MNTFSIDQGLISKLSNKVYNTILPDFNKKLIQESFENKKCQIFCGKKTPYCKDVVEEKDICTSSIDLDSEQKCNNAFGGKSCEWETNEWRECTSKCKQMKCNNCTGRKHTSDIDSIEQLFNNTLKEYVAAYKSLDDENLTETEIREILERISILNKSLMKISNEFYKKILNLEKRADEKDKDYSKIKKRIKKNMNNIKKKNKNIVDFKNTAKDQPKNALADNDLRVNYAYTRYLFWLAIASILIIGIIVLALNVPVMESSFKYGYLLFMIILIWFLFSRIWRDFIRELRYIISQ